LSESTTLKNHNIVSQEINLPADDRSTLILVPLNVFLAGLDVGDVSQTESTGESGDSNHRVGGDVGKPDGLVVDLVDHLAREVAATGNAVTKNKSKQ